MDRTVRVTGKGRVSVKPDIVRVMITSSEVNKEYEKAVELSASRKKELTDKLSEIAVSAEDLKTLQFRIDSEYESYEDKNHCWKQRLIGYRFTHVMKLEFSVMSGLLGKVLYVLAHLKGEPEFRIQYTVSNPESAKNALLSDAVRDAREKALVLSKAADITLGEIMSVNYSFEEVNLTVSPMSNMMLGECKMADCADEIDIDINPDDVVAEDTVTVIWAIK